MSVALTWLLPDGRAGGRSSDGRTVRISGAVPGDEVEFDRIGGTGTTDDGVCTSVVVPSPNRRPPPCPHSARCGGCDLDALDPDGQAAAKARTVAHAFRWDGEVPLHRSPPGGSRARIKLAIADGASGFHPPRSHEVVPIDRCGVARPEVGDAHARLGAWLTPERARGLRAVELRSDGERVVFAFESDGGAVDRDALAALGDVALDGKRVSGDPTLRLQVGGVTLRASPGSFFQVNPAVNAQLVDAVRHAITSRRCERVLDLYAGIGNFGLPIAAGGTAVVAVESPGSGAEDLRFNARAVPDPSKVQVHAMRVEKLDPSRIAFDAVVLDPPRAGAPGVLTKVARNRPAVVVYVSCFAPNAARDLKELGKYELVSLSAFDLFPDTHHVEALAVWERR